MVKGEDQQQQHPLQAVVIADAAELRFRPITLEMPRCLLPLVNVPLIEYTLEFLAVSGVQEIFIFCKSHSEKIKQYIAQSKWSSKTRSMALRIQVIVAPEANGIGDVMRELDAKSLIQTDFILVTGNVVSNMKLEAVLAEHKARRGLSTDALMTIVMKRATPHHRSRAHGEGALVAVDASTHECLHFEVVDRYPPKKRISLDSEIFAKHASVHIYNDLIDSQVDICSVEVPALFTENFDYQDIRRDFVRGVLESDLLGKSIHLHILNEEYAARVRSTLLYDSISRDIISRWTFPMVPDSNIHLENSSYKHYRGHIYKEKDVVLSRSCELKENVVIGCGTQIGSHTIITNCTIGRNCRIGNNILLSGAYIWDNVVIEDGCLVDRSILADGVHLKSNVKVNRGCLISFNVIIGPDISLPAFTKLTTQPPPEMLEKGLGNVPNSIVGASGNAFVWDASWEEDEDEELEEEQSENALLWRLGYEPADLVMTSADFDDTFSDYCTTESSFGEYEHYDELHRHYMEVEDTINRSIEENHTVENALLELNALKMACNITFHDLRKSTIPAILKHIDHSRLEESMRKLMSKWLSLIKRFTSCQEDQIDCLWITVDYCCRLESSVGPNLFFLLLKLYYEKDLVDEDPILEWFSQEDNWQSTASDDEDYQQHRITPSFAENRRKIRKNAAEFVKWLEEAETESD